MQEKKSNKKEVKDKTQLTFFSLLQAGLWSEPEKQVAVDGAVNWDEIYQLASEQSVLGLVLAGIDCLPIDQRPPKLLLLQWIGEIQMLEQQNKEMNLFIGEMVKKMRKEGIYTLLVKGQGIAQSYDRPLWRSSGDVDLLLSKDNYPKAKRFLLPLSSSQKNDERYSKHKGMSIDPWYVEIHGTLRTGLSGRVDKEVDAVQDDVFFHGNVRPWDNNGTTVFLPSADNDVFFIFTHFIKHFYKEGMNLRQLCDWCRLLWTFRDSLKHGLLELRIRKAGLMSEWKAFAALVVEYLGMPVKAMPMYDKGNLWSKKAKNILKFIMKGGQPNALRDIITIMKIFPYNTFKFMPSIFLNVNGFKIYERLFPES